MTYWLLCIFLVIISTLLSISIYFNYKHGILIIKTVDEIEGALEVLDKKYESVSKILEIPLFFDSPQVKQLHNDIGACRDSILQVASSLGNVDTEK
ncbi:MAG: hypothetical protein H8E12_11820 [Rhodobacteraceae bacterium]|nr:hypothetical protein [Paracoccaceae bacterium]